MIDVCEYKAAI